VYWFIIFSKESTVLPAGKDVALSVLALVLALLIGVLALLVAEAAVGAEKVAEEERVRAMRSLRVMFLLGELVRHASWCGKGEQGRRKVRREYKFWLVVVVRCASWCVAKGSAWCSL